jgi:hypothetical protein
MIEKEMLIQKERLEHLIRR